MSLITRERQSFVELAPANAARHDDHSVEMSAQPSEAPAPAAEAEAEAEAITALIDAQSHP